MMSCIQGRACDKLASKIGNECGSNVAFAYFVSFIFLCNFLMLNLFVAVIMDNFDYLTRDTSILGAHHLDEFIRVWAEYDPNASGWIHYKEMYDMLRNMDPPLGFGNKCPYRLAYKKLIRMNMPVNEQGQVNFTTTLFALIRENLSIKMRPAEEMDQADKELRDTIKKLWPLQAKKIVDKLIPHSEEVSKNKMSVGKIYGGMLILESWRTTKFGQSGSVGHNLLVSRLLDTSFCAKNWMSSCHLEYLLEGLELCFVLTRFLSSPYPLCFPRNERMSHVSLSSCDMSSLVCSFLTGKMRGTGEHDFWMTNGPNAAAVSPVTRMFFEWLGGDRV
jgi:hypothetical protein